MPPKRASCKVGTMFWGFHSGQQAFTAAGTQPGNQICAHLAAGMQQ